MAPCIHEQLDDFKRGSELSAWHDYAGAPVAGQSEEIKLSKIAEIRTEYLSGICVTDGGICSRKKSVHGKSCSSSLYNVTQRP